jgi:Spy/CpxP family protein refolding chaperone
MNLLRTFFLSASCLLAVAAGPPAQAQARLGGRGRLAQPGGRLNQLDNARIAFITGRLTLTQDQAQRFWPVYNEFVAKRRELNRSARQVRLAISNTGLSDAQLRDSFSQEFGIRQQQLNLEKDYFERAQKVLSLRQVAQLYQAERDFTKEVLQRVAGRPGAAPEQE